MVLSQRNSSMRNEKKEVSLLSCLNYFIIFSFKNYSKM